VYLCATVQELWVRLRHDKVRPLLRTPDPRRRIAQLVETRDPLYRECAHLIVQTGRQPVDRVVEAIVAGLPAGVAPAGPPVAHDAQSRHIAPGAPPDGGPGPTPTL
jgi:shikimate kinase